MGSKRGECNHLSLSLVDSDTRCKLDPKLSIIRLTLSEKPFSVISAVSSYFFRTNEITKRIHQTHHYRDACNERTIAIRRPRTCPPSGIIQLSLNSRIIITDSSGRKN